MDVGSMLLAARLIFAVYANDGGCIIDPIAKTTELPRSQAAVLYRDGARVGTVRAGAAKQLGCVSHAAEASIEGSRPEVGEVLLAANFEVRERMRRDRELSADEDRAMRRYAKIFLREHGAKTTGELEVNARVIDAGGELLVVGSWSTPDAACEGSLFLIARLDDVTADAVKPQLARFRERADCDDGGFIQLLDHIDIDGDGFDEVIGRDDGQEGYDYLIFRRMAGAVWTIERGAETGC